jgi:hypothetical protein
MITRQRYLTKTNKQTNNKVVSHVECGDRRHFAETADITAAENKSSQISIANIDNAAHSPDLQRHVVQPSDVARGDKLERQRPAW